MLEKDLGNFDSVVEQIRDVRGLDRLVRRTYEEIVASNRFGFPTMVAELDAVIDEWETERSPASRIRYRLARIEHPFGNRLPHGVRRRRLLLGAPKEAVREAVVGISSAMVLATDRKARGFIWGALAGRAVKSVAEVRRLEQDLIRLAIVRRAQQGRLTAGPSFAVRAEFREDEGQLMLRSISEEGLVSPSLHGTQDLEQFDLRAVRRITWDHSVLPTSFRFA